MSDGLRLFGLARSVYARIARLARAPEGAALLASRPREAGRGSGGGRPAMAGGSKRSRSHRESQFKAIR